ncbi:MAG TPA: sulfatase/phosphatase domain-containing protein [Phnomibacter sp.]|nr:sulfatase/phosphatase domain-containing protein [Phnomibacter sp.]
MMRSLLLILAFYASLGLPCSVGQPNIIYIMSDDHDADAISAYNASMIQTPNIDRLAKEGTRYTHCFVGNSICSPARATLLTGQHSHMNGVRDNRTPFDTGRTHIAHWLNMQGYQTALIGKWHLHSLPRGFQHWEILPGQGLYHQPRLIQMAGDTLTREGYATEVITERTLDWLQNKRQAGKPFALFMHHKAPHRNFLPALKYLRQCANKTYPEPPTLLADALGRGKAWQLQTMTILKDMGLSRDLKVDPALIADLPHFVQNEEETRYYHGLMNRIPEPDRSAYKKIYAARAETLRRQQPTGHALLKLKYQWYMQDYMACIASVDESVGAILDYLDRTGLAGNTLVMYTSDQGFYLGENGWYDKRFMYDVSMHTPLLIRWPGKVVAGKVDDHLRQNIDFAPTILQTAGAPIPHQVQGISLWNEKAQNEREYLYYHYYEYAADHTVIPHLGIRGQQYKLIYFYTVDEWELYDLATDPWEQKNLVNDPGHTNLLEILKGTLVKEARKYGDEEAIGHLTK